MMSKKKSINLLDMQREYIKDKRKKRKLEMRECPTTCPRYKEQYKCTPDNCIEVKRRYAKMDKATLRAFKRARGDKVQLEKDERRKHRKGVPYRDRIILKEGVSIGRGQPNEWGLRDEPIWDNVCGDKTVWALPSGMKYDKKGKMIDEGYVTHRVTICGIKFKEVLEKNGKTKKEGFVRRILARVEVYDNYWNKLHRKGHSYLICEYCGYRKDVPPTYRYEYEQRCPMCSRKLTLRICKACLSAARARRKAWEWYTKKLLPSIGKEFVYLPYDRFEEKIVLIGRSVGKVWKG